MSKKATPVRAEQHITATVTIAGPLRFTVSALGDGGPGSHINVGLAGVLITVYDQQAVQAYAFPWETAAGLIYADKLPSKRPLIALLGQSSISVAVVAHRSHRQDVTPGRYGLAVHLGSLRWMVMDQAAYSSQIEVWNEVSLLAETALPEQFEPIV